jgi:hypothetical protein
MFSFPCAPAKNPPTIRVRALTIWTSLARVHSEHCQVYGKARALTHIGFLSCDRRSLDSVSVTVRKACLFADRTTLCDARRRDLIASCSMASSVVNSRVQTVSSDRRLGKRPEEPGLQPGFSNKPARLAPFSSRPGRPGPFGPAIDNTDGTQFSCQITVQHSTGGPGHPAAGCFGERRLR